MGNSSLYCLLPARGPKVQERQQQKVENQVLAYNLQYFFYITLHGMFKIIFIDKTWTFAKDNP